MIGRRNRPNPFRQCSLSWRAGELRAYHLVVAAASVLLAMAAAVYLLAPGAPSGSRPGQATFVQIHILPAPGPVRPDSGAKPPETEENEPRTFAIKPLQPTLKAPEPRRETVVEPPRLHDRKGASGPVGPSIVLDEPPPLFAEGAPRRQGRAADYQRILFDHIKRFRHYPDAARVDRTNGVVKLVFVLRRDGTLLEARVAGSSGHAVLDQSAIDMIWRAHPLPAIPEDLPGHLKITLPVEYSATH